MNQTQRKFLIDKIQKESDSMVKVLKDSKPEFPSVQNWLFAKVLSGDIKIKSEQEIKQAIKEKALKSKSNDRDWLSGTSMYSSRSSCAIVFESVWDVIEKPEEISRLLVQYDADTFKIQSEINDIKIKTDSLITRIQLASDKTLEKVIAEIDDMGNLSLFDTKLRLASGADIVAGKLNA